MIKLYLLKQILVVCLLLGCVQVMAQSVRVTGKVTSSDDGGPLPGVSILEKGTTNGSVTDSDGNFSVNVSQNATLVFSFVGYASQEISVGATNINVVLQSDVTSLNEVVVIGYGEVQKKDATGAVMNISSRDFNKGVLTSPQDLVVGKFAGVSVTSNSGAPGSNSTIRIRGGSSLTANNDPLIVIDGFPIDNTTPSGISNPIASLNPNDIETFTVLKDASATAIYGSRAANGVIIITTKKGTGGKKMQLSYNGNVSVSTPVKYVDVMTGDEFRELIDELTPEGTAGLNEDAKANLGTANTDWQREIFRSAVSHDHNISASGSLKNLPYRISYGYTDQQGILKTTGIQRHSLNLNLTPTLLNDNLKLTINAKGSRNVSDFGDAGAVGNAVSFDPTQSVYDENSEYGGYFSWLARTDVNGVQIRNGNTNPVAMLEQTDNQGTANRFIGNIQAEYQLPFFKDISVNLNTGFDRTESDGYNRSPLEAGFLHSSGTLIGRDNSYSATNRSELLDLYFVYNKTIGDHKVEATAGYGWQHFYRESATINSNELATDSTLAKSENFLVSFFGRLNYTLKGKYLLTATLRNDGSSRFSEENRWGLFPSLALAWRIKDETFLTGVEVLSDLKLRVGYGVTGQQEIVNSYYPYLPVYRVSNELARYPLGTTYHYTLRPEPYDANIKWEEATTYNLGIDFGFFNDNLTGSIEVFQKNTDDLLNYIQVANGSGFSNFLTTNVGSMENQGIEITLNATPVSREDFGWRVGFNFTSINSKITKLNLTDDPNYPGVSQGNVGVGAFIQNHQVGFPAFSFYTYQQVYDETGKPIEALYVNRSGEAGAVVGNNNNKYRYQKPAPDFLIGLNSSVRYNQFDFSFSSRLSIGNYVYNNVASGSAYYNNVYTQLHFRNVPTSVRETDFISQQTYSDYYVENASFFKMDNMSVGYNLDKVLEKVKARLSFTVQNAFVITKYSGIDPEVNEGRNLEGIENRNGIDANIYPRPRTFLVGFNVTF